MSDHFRRIYAAHADQYDRMVSREDYQGNLLPALERIRPLAGLDVIEFGAGTGRLTRLLAPLVRSIWAFDASPHMLGVASDSLREMGLHNWHLAAADNSSLPVGDSCADLAIEGWSFGHATGWYPDRWREEIGAALGEMRRVLRLGGTAVVIETLGTGFETPRPPSPVLGEYYLWLEQEHGFTSSWVRTDYRFESLEEAVELTRFFFGDGLAEQVKQHGWIVLPECTGIWWRVY
jgi:ubiquinone/menaquinone biosynthesis C-methylase UbiE